MFLEEESRSRRAMKQIPLVIPHIAAGKKKVYYWENINTNKLKWRRVTFSNNVSLSSSIIVDRSSSLRFFNIYIFWQILFYYLGLKKSVKLYKLWMQWHFFTHETINVQNNEVCDNTQKLINWCLKQEKLKFLFKYREHNHLRTLNGVHVPKMLNIQSLTSFL